MKSLSHIRQRPHGLQPTRLRPWDLPGKSTGVGCQCLLQISSGQNLKELLLLIFTAYEQQQQNSVRALLHFAVWNVFLPASDSDLITGVIIVCSCPQFWTKALRFQKQDKWKKRSLNRKSDRTLVKRLKITWSGKCPMIIHIKWWYFWQMAFYPWDTMNEWME